MPSLVDIALKYEGYPATSFGNPKFSGNTPEGFGCSGYVQWVILESGITIPNVPSTDRMIRYSEEFFDFFGYPIHEQAKRAGDLIFFSKNGYRPTHIGICIGEERMISSPGDDNGKVEISPIAELCGKDYLEFHPEKGYPQIYFYNPIGYKRIGVPSKTRRLQSI